MIYRIPVRKNNRLVYLDIIRDMVSKKNGLFSFTLRMNAGNIVDYVTMEVITYKSINGSKRG